MESIYDFTIRRNQELAEKEGYELVYYIVNKRYSTLSGNRTSISSTLVQALLTPKGKLGNRVNIKTVETDLVRNYKSTKSTTKTHNKKINKLLESLQ